MGDDSKAWCFLILILIWFSFNIGDAFWIYFYIQACVNPNPRTAVNRTHSGFESYQVMMYLFGFPWGCINLSFVWLYYGWAFTAVQSVKSAWWRTTVVTANVFLVGPVALLLVIMPFFGGWIVLPIAQDVAWNHRCDSYPMYAILRGRGYNDPSYVPVTASFFLTGSSSSLFSYDIPDPSNSDIMSFQLRELDTDASHIPINSYPTLQHISYDFVTSTVSGNCTIPSAGGSNTTTNVVGCMSGTFNPGFYLSFNLTSSVPLNISSSNAATQSNSMTLLRAVDRQWEFGNDAPSLILDTVDPSGGALKQTVLRTAVTLRKDCTQLKVCIAGIEGRPGTEVGAEVLTPLGLILINQMNYAIQCTTPSNSGT